MNCEICGAFEENLLRTDVEGAILNLCRDCSKYGRVVETTAVSSGSNLNERDEPQLKSNYAEIISDELRKNNLSIAELADNLKCSPKDLKKVALGEIQPSDILVKKLEKFFKISLYEADYVSDSNFIRHTNSLSFGDVVDIKRKK